MSNQFLSFLQESMTPWHAAAQICARLIEKRGQELSETTTWAIEPGGLYFVVRNGAVIAFRMPKKKLKAAIFLAAHTDSPCLKVKQCPENKDRDMIFLTVELYGSPILSSWLNRDLILAGKVTYGKNKSKLICLQDHPLIIPSIAIHLEKDLNEKQFPLDKQLHLSPLADISKEEYLLPLLAEKINGDVLDFDLFVIPAEPPSLVGRNKQWIASHRIDNLAGAYAALDALCQSEAMDDTMQMAVWYNAEEIGSRTYDGAMSPFLHDTLKRVCLAAGLNEEEFFCFKNRSFCVSIDGAHAYHPSYKDRYDPGHLPILGKGIVLKYSASQKYTSSATSTTPILQICTQHNFPYQKFVSHSSIPGGSTVGPLSVQQLGILSVDIGIPQLSMHSAREIMAISDQVTMQNVLTTLFEQGIA